MKQLLFAFSPGSVPEHARTLNRERGNVPTNGVHQHVLL